MRPTQLVYAAHGSPSVDGEALAGRCFVCCGETLRGVATDKWLKSSFTDQTRARNPTSEVVCEACVYVHARNSPVLGRPAKPGKKFGGNFRNYSHLYSHGWEGEAFGESPAVENYANASKGEKPLIRRFLGMVHSGPWFAGIADSGQKHVLPYAPMNGPSRGGVVRFEEAIVAVPDSLELVSAMTAALTAGCTKDEITSGDYTPRAWGLCETLIREFEDAFSTDRGSEWFSLAIWLAQRDEEAVAERLEREKHAKREKQGSASNRNRRSTTGAEKSVPTRTRKQRNTETLGAPADEARSVRAHDSDPRGVAHGDAAPPKDTTRKQLRLFGDA